MAQRKIKTTPCEDETSTWKICILMFEATTGIVYFLQSGFLEVEIGEVVYS